MPKIKTFDSEIIEEENRLIEFSDGKRWITLTEFCKYFGCCENTGRQMLKGISKHNGKYSTMDIAKLLKGRNN